jgi:hypothetical protein
MPNICDLASIGQECFDGFVNHQGWQMTRRLIAQTPAVTQPGACTPAPSGQLAAVRGHRSPFGDRVTGDWEHEGQNVKVSAAPMMFYPEAGSKLLAKCPPEKLLLKDKREDNRSLFVPKIALFKTNRYSVAHENAHHHTSRSRSAITVLILIAVTILIICTPFVFIFAYLTGQRELPLICDQADAFTKWRKQKASTMKCFLLSCSGFCLFLLGIADYNDLNSKYIDAATSLTGIGLSVLAFAIWWRNLEA